MNHRLKYRHLLMSKPTNQLLLGDEAIFDSRKLSSMRCYVLPVFLKLRRIKTGSEPLCSQNDQGLFLLSCNKCAFDRVVNSGSGATFTVAVALAPLLLAESSGDSSAATFLAAFLALFATATFKKENYFVLLIFFRAFSRQCSNFSGR